MIIVTAKNSVTGELVVLGSCHNEEDVIEHCENIEYDEGENPSEWEIFVDGIPYDEFYDDFLAYCEDGDIDLEMGFDPYEGCYSYDC